MLREQPGLFGPVASDPTVSRPVDTLAGDVDAALAGLREAAGARAVARERSVGWGVGDAAGGSATTAVSVARRPRAKLLESSHCEGCLTTCPRAGNESVRRK